LGGREKNGLKEWDGGRRSQIKENQKTSLHLLLRLVTREARILINGERGPKGALARTLPRFTGGKTIVAPLRMFTPSLGGEGREVLESRQQEHPGVIVALLALERPQPIDVLGVEKGGEMARRMEALCPREITSLDSSTLDGIFASRLRQEAKNEELESRGQQCAGQNTVQGRTWSPLINLKPANNMARGEGGDKET